jgi:glucokinase
VLSLDVGGTRVKAGLVEDTNVFDERTVDVGKTFEATLEKIRSVGRDVSAGRKLPGAGMCVPGLVDERGIVVSLPGKHSGIEGYDLPGFLRDEFGGKAVVVNDAVAYAVGEALAGAGVGFPRVVVMTIGTGVGVTVVESGRPLGAGELGGGILGGHIPISERTEGYLDTNGRPDTLEALCLAGRIVDYANDAGGSYTTVTEVYEGFQRGESAAREGATRYREHLIRGLVAVAHAHAPDAIVVGGGPLTPGNPLLDGVEGAINQRLFGSFKVELRRAELGDTAALIGVARLLARQEDSV